MSTATNQLHANRRTAWAWTVGTFFGIGRLQPGPGTWASVATVLLWWLGGSRLHLTATIIVGSRTFVWALPATLITVIVTAIGIPASTRVARESGVHDPGFVVIDEVAGQMLPLIIAPLTWKSLLLSLILFRCFDILKPPPLRALERLPDGVGIMLDDIGAGLYALLVLAAVLKFWPAL
ncbi:MAG: phosphatidylglycerophosphatase A [Acidobacteria bacterium]|nr:phosphatidylglycerophosphatase A [Acidobacteriota bacterium]MBV9434417.1 phosphatidylglycerophosphatase A [Acidobacteriota bacterium]